MGSPADTGRIRTPAEAFEAGRARRRADGYRLTELQAERIARILRPHVRRTAQLRESA